MGEEVVAKSPVTKHPHQTKSKMAIVKVKKAATKEVHEWITGLVCR
jgi:hypothetical protein